MHELSHLSLGRDLLPICISITYIFDNKSRSMPSFSNLIALIETSENSVTRKKNIYHTTQAGIIHWPRAFFEVCITKPHNAYYAL